MIIELEDDNTTQDFFLSHKKLRKGEIILVEFFDMLGNFLSNKVHIFTRRSDAGDYCCMFAPLKDMIDQASSLLLPSTPIPSENYLVLRLATKNSRAAVINRCCNRFNVKSKCQNHALFK